MSRNSARLCGIAVGNRDQRLPESLVKMSLLVVTSATLVVTGALLVVTRFASSNSFTLPY